MNKFLRQLITEWRRLELPVKDATVLVAVSGGADSVSLLVALAELKKRKKLDLNFVVAHFNHDLRGKQSDKDEAFVKKLSRKFEFDFRTAKWDTAIEHKSKDLEQEARLARYNFLERIAEDMSACAIL